MSAELVLPMHSEGPRTTLLRLQLTFVIAFSLSLLGWLSWDAYQDYSQTEEQLPLLFRMQQVRTDIIRLQEVMSESAQMASTTGNVDWERRYLQAEPQLDRLIAEAARMAPDMSLGASIAKTGAANDELVAMQHGAFGLARQGQKAAAQRLLASERHETETMLSAQGMKEFDADLLRSSDRVSAALVADKRFDVIATAASVVLLMLGSLFAFRATRQWRTAIVDSNRQLNRKTLELEQFNDQLDMKVSERTRELSESALASLNMMEDAVRERENTVQAHGRLDFLAYYDVLTDLANRRLFLDRVAQYTRSAASGGRKLALILIDLERFRNINDSLGRDGGDALLKQMAQWLTDDLGDANLVARVGPDHFAVVLPDVKNEGDVARFVEKSMADLQDHSFALNGAAFRITVKLGIAIFPEDGVEAEILFKNAEAALKKAKASGERYLFYTQKMTEMVAGKLTMENQLRQALDNEEFVLHYQPKVDLRSGRLTSAEALIRWNDPRTGLVPPFKFIPILEETGLINEVGRWALRKAVTEYLRWRAAGLMPVRIAVNVSPLQLRNRGFIAEVAQAISLGEGAAAGLELEITESMIMEDVNQSTATLQAIRDMGIIIAIDDFGTGFSSLGYLSKLPVDTLKIDRSFIIDMTQSPEGLSLVSTMVNLGHSLKLKIVAEGVETEEQSNLLRLLKCDEMQGYLFSKPVPADVFEEKFLGLSTGN